ncbi:DUF2066 domain-containing protein [Ferrimonas sp. YFM]|uniref:DUF2066 domain-containing protein n=1 Tax=Ferrimonas sp. YFM TaxID=3028878 RepID=UPI0025722E2A|nr:DUF2066 domain-containing protein [Ferrimonas sp. YFM]
MKRLAFLLPLLFCSSALAVEVANLYQAQVQVEGRERAERQQKIPDALMQTLVRLTGDDAVAEDPRMKGMLGNPTRFVSSFGYGGDPLTLTIQFDGSLLVKEMQQRQLPVWGKQRPLTLGWVALEDEQGERQLMSEQLDAQMLEAWREQSELRGLPLSLPLMDLEDAIRVGLNDVWGFFVDPVAEASERYQADFFMLARVWPGTEGWYYALALYPYQQGDQADRYGFGSVRRSVMQKSGQAEGLEQGLMALQRELAGYYARRYATVASEEEAQKQLVFEIQGSMSELVAVERYLRGLSAIASLQVTALQDRQVSFAVELVGSADALAQILELEPRVETLVSDDEMVTQTRYRWIGDQ